MIERVLSASFIIWAILIAQWALLTGAGTAADLPDFRQVLRAYDSPLATVASETEAKALFVAHLAQALGLQDMLSPSPIRATTPSSTGTAARNSESPESDVHAIRLTADLAGWRLATALKHAADGGASHQLPNVLKSTERQRLWLIDQQPSPALSRAVRLASVLSSLPIPESASSQTLSQYDEYARYLDQTYPRLIESDDSWTASAEQEGLHEIQRRLLSFWNQPDKPAVPASTADERDSLQARYVDLRLRPVLTAQLIALAVRAEAEAEHRVHGAWHDLLAWREKRQEARGLARLCGTWQWTVHNHQNHQDHKLMMVFPPPVEGGSPARARPTKITVLGDGVYLRWNFQGGYQEDSLLFTGEGQRLEGSFVNSAGAWGSITGKRIAACGK